MIPKMSKEIHSLVETNNKKKGTTRPLQNHSLHLKQSQQHLLWNRIDPNQAPDPILPFFCRVLL